MELNASTLGRVKRCAVAVLPRNRFARSVTLLAGGTALGQAVTVAVSPVLTRLYSPADFGAFGVYASLLGIITVIASLRYEYAIPLPEEEETAVNLVGLCFLLLAMTSSAAWVAVHFLAARIVVWANVPALRPYLWLVPLGMFGAGAYQILNYWAVRQRDFPRIARTRLSRGVSRAALQVGTGAVYSGPLGLLLGQLAGESAGSASLGLAAWGKDRVCFKAVSLRGMRQAAGRYRRFPLFSGWADLFGSLGLQLPQLLLAAFYGPAVAGWFALGQRVIAAPLNIIVDSVAQVFFGEAVRTVRTDPQAARRLFLKLSGRLALTGGLPVAAICTLAPWFFTSIFGPAWEVAGRYVQIMGAMFAVRFAVVPLVHTFSVLERQDLYLFWQATRLVLVVGGLSAGKALGAPHLSAVLIYSASMSVAYVLMWVIIWSMFLRNQLYR